ncbi:MAG: DNA repair protein RecN [Pseudomonadota bacterium]
MLRELSITDIVLIEKLTVSFGDGLSALTGETGAGKSILLDSLALALGARGDASLVRKGCAKGQVIAIFDAPGNALDPDMLDEAGLELEAGEPLIMRRVQSSDGKTRGYINDQSVSAQMMRTIASQLVEIHGQHADRALVDISTHRQLLDSFGRLQSTVASVGLAHTTWAGARRAAEDHRRMMEEAKRELEYIQASSDELAALNPQPGEEDALSATRTKMMQSEKVAGDLSDAIEVLIGNNSPVPQIGGLLRTLERKADGLPDVLPAVNDHLGQALDHLAEAQMMLEHAANDAEFDQRALDETEERLFALRAASRKFNVSVETLPALAVEFADQLTAVDDGDAKLAVLEKEEAETREKLSARCAELTKLRQSAAEELEDTVNAELPPLKLERARFIVHFETDPEKPGAHGCDEIEFYVQTNPGSNPGPMMKIASGGELSRFLLALKVVIADRVSAPTLVFDEIDTGVGGAVADAIGARLARLASSVQVLTVTHAPQVAAAASSHLLISKKEVSPELVATAVHVMDETERQEEIARMLSGASVTDEARAAAARLLQQ